MYSLLLMTAMAGSPDAAAFGWRSGGCNGCYGGAAIGCSGFSSCYGGGFAGCGGFSCSGYGCGGSSSCNGCRGGGFLGLGLLDRLHGRRASCHGCSGYSCHGSSCYGSSCHGGGYSAGWGSCYGSGYGSGCWGSCYGSGIGSGCWGSSCYGGGIGAGCHGGAAGYGASVGQTWIDPIPAAPVITVPAAPVAPAPAAPTTGGASSQSPARLTVELPTTAKLFVDGAEVSGAGATRQFHTPDLPAGGSYFYDLRAEVEVNGTVQTEEKRVVVRAGETATASFAKLAAAVSDAGAVAVK